MNRGILQSALQNPGLRLELEYRQADIAGSDIRSSWKLTENKDLDINDSAAWFDFCRALLQVEAAEAL